MRKVMFTRVLAGATVTSTAALMMTAGAVQAMTNQTTGEGSWTSVDGVSHSLRLEADAGHGHVYYTENGTLVWTGTVASYQPVASNVVDIGGTAVFSSGAPAVPFDLVITDNGPGASIQRDQVTLLEYGDTEIAEQWIAAGNYTIH